MASLKRAAILTCLILSLCLVTSVQATSEKIPVYPLKSATLVFRLENGSATIEAASTVSGTVYVLGFSSPDKYIIFLVKGPTNTATAYFGNITRSNFSFVAPTTGNYTAYFDNTFSTSGYPKEIDLDYSIAPPIFGMPQALFYTILTIIVVVIIAAVAIVIALFIVLRRCRRSEQAKRK